jgi:hypothetical protein
MDDPKELTEEERRQLWLQSIIDAEPEDGAFAGDPDSVEDDADAAANA